MATPEKPTKQAVPVKSPDSQKTFETFLHEANEMKGIDDSPEIKMRKEDLEARVRYKEGRDAHAKPR